MLLSSYKYRNPFLLKSVVIFGFIFSFSTAASAQVYYNNMFGKYPKMNPLLSGALRKSVKPDPVLSEYIKPSKYELMYWPNFPLTPEQIQVRDRERQRKSKQSIGQQIVGNIADSYIRSLLSGKKKCP